MIEYVFACDNSQECGNVWNAMVDDNGDGTLGGVPEHCPQCKGPKITPLYEAQEEAYLTLKFCSVCGWEAGDGHNWEAHIMEMRAN